MIFLQIVVVIVVLAAWLTVSARAQESRPRGEPSLGFERFLAMSREDVQRALKKIEAGPAPVEKMGAMCYKAAMAPDNMEYICPLDGEKTVFARGAKAYGQAESVVETRRLLKDLGARVRGVSFSLDERTLCSRCSPGLDDKQRQASLILQFADGRVVRTDDVSSQDIRYLEGFFSGGISYKTSNDGELPLKQVDARLRELLGEKGEGQWLSFK